MQFYNNCNYKPLIAHVHFNFEFLYYFTISRILHEYSILDNNSIIGL